MATEEPVLDWQKQEAPEAASVSVGLSERLLLTTVEGRQTVFAEKSQLVFEPNAASCAILALLDTPRPLITLVDQLTPAFGGDKNAVVDVLVEWSKAGLIDVFPPNEANCEPPSATVCLSALDATIDLHVHGEDIDWFDCYRHLPKSSGAVQSIQAWQYADLGVIKVSGQQGRIIPRHMLAANFRFSLVESILNQTKCIVFHCACLMKGDQAILLLGEPGAGKSTLGMFASQHGLELGGDDIALFDPISGRIFPLALPLTLKQGSWPMIARSDWKCERQERVLREDKVQVVYLPLWQSAPKGPLAVSALILLDRSHAADMALPTWPKIDCLRHLCSESRSHAGVASVEDIQALLVMLTSAETLCLKYANAAEAGKMLGNRFGE